MNRHLKKYVFYIIARFLALIGRYDDSLDYYSKVIQFRTFFWDVQERYKRAYQNSSKKCSKSNDFGKVCKRLIVLTQ